MSERPVNYIIQDMLDAIDGIEEFINGISEDVFLTDRKTQAAVERYLEILGEAANKLSDDFRLKYDYMQWHRIISLRNRIIHAYFNVDKRIVWNIITNFIPPLKHDLKNIASSI